MSRERRDISQRKIRRIQRSTEDSTFQLEPKSESFFRGLKPNAKMYYTKVGFGLGSGIITGMSLLFLNISPDLWLVMLIIAFIICIFFIRYVLKISSEEIDMKRLWLSGTVTFLLMFIVMASLIWMIPGPRTVP